ncbi:sugar kinase [Jeotgalibacillus haloalkalitolerans]|uniref:Sugar kinase n=1 Tax=Jeotgalibacillus haloalkalitolerans TaxID=3104292 RepID=A0ABU5KJ98_9BACL|nr:sugar kinase [Jeotgalibacillus sp. HH7-29]MDZ5711334.1 sugar kinase [Jeotgalibacillus sp. HH7-29]
MDVVTLGETMVSFTPQTTGLMRYARHYQSAFAGAETNTMTGLSRLGHQTGWISRVGDDELGASVLSFVRGEGIDVSHVLKDSTAPTALMLKEMLNEEHVRVYYYRQRSAASNLQPEDIDESYIARAKYLYITGITPALSSSCLEAVQQAITYAKKHSVKVIFDPNLRKKLWEEEHARKILLELAAQSDIVLPGIAEGEFLFGIQDEKEIARRFIENGAGTVITKLGEHGAYYVSGGEETYVPGFKVKAIDPVGAGDGFAAGVISGLLDGLSGEEAVRRGCAIGAMVTTTSGDIEGLPDRRLLENFMADSKEDVSR